MFPESQSHKELQINTAVTFMLVAFQNRGVRQVSLDTGQVVTSSGNFLADELSFGAKYTEILISPQGS